MSYHFVLQVSQTLSLHSKSLPCKGATEPNKPPRKAALFWTLLPQLFVQFEAQFEAEPLSLLNAQSDDTTKQPRPTKQLSYNRYGDTPYSRFLSGIPVFFCPAALCAAGERPDKCQALGDTFPQTPLRVYALRVARFRATALFATSKRCIRSGDRTEQATAQGGVVLDVATAVARTGRSATRSRTVVVVERPKRRHWVCHFTPTILSRRLTTTGTKMCAICGFYRSH